MAQSDERITSENAYVGSKKKKQAKTETVRYQCPICGVYKDEFEYYKSGSSILWTSTGGRITAACKDCFQGKYNLMAEQYGEESALKIACHWLDAAFVPDLYENLNAKYGTFDLQTYMSMVSRKPYNLYTWINTNINFSGPEETPQRAKRKETEADWKRDELRTKEECIEMMGQDPFEGYPDEKRRYLFGELIKYLDEDVIEDPYKMSQIVQVVINNGQIRDYDLLISKADPIKSSDTIKTLNQLKKDLVTSNDKIAKENEISVKNRSNKEAGRSSLGYLMRDLRGKDFREAETNFYDMLQSPSTQWAADMSMKAILQNTLFDENDRQEIFINQRNLIQKLQKELDDSQEEARVLKVKLKELGDG